MEKTNQLMKKNSKTTSRQDTEERINVVKKAIFEIKRDPNLVRKVEKELLC